MDENMSMNRTSVELGERESLSSRDDHVPHFCALGQHAWLAHREWVDILWLETSQRVVDKSVSGLVAANGVDHVKQTTHIPRIVSPISMASG